MTKHDVPLKTLIDAVHDRMEEVCSAMHDVTATHERLLKAGVHLERQKQLHREQVDMLAERIQASSVAPTGQATAAR